MWEAILTEAEGLKSGNIKLKGMSKAGYEAAMKKTPPPAEAPAEAPAEGESVSEAEYATEEERIAAEGESESYSPVSETDEAPVSETDEAPVSETDEAPVSDPEQQIESLVEWYQSPDGGNIHMGDGTEKYTVDALLGGMTSSNMVEYIQAASSPEDERSRAALVWEDRDNPRWGSKGSGGEGRRPIYLQTADTFGEFLGGLRRHFSETPSAEPDMSTSDTGPDMSTSDTGPDMSTSDTEPDMSTSETSLLQGSAEIGGTDTGRGIAAGLVQDRIDNLFSGRNTLQSLDDGQLSMLLKEPIRSLGNSAGVYLIQEEQDKRQ